MIKKHMNILEYIELLKCFPRDSMLYWINKLDIPISYKGYLIVYFKLLGNIK